MLQLKLHYKCGVRSGAILSRKVPIFHSLCDHMIMEYHSMAGFKMDAL